MATSLQASPVMVAGSPEVGPPARSRPQAMRTRTHAPRARALTWYLPGVGDMSPSTTDTGQPDIQPQLHRNRHTEFLVTPRAPTMTAPGAWAGLVCQMFATSIGSHRAVSAP